MEMSNNAEAGPSRGHTRLVKPTRPFESGRYKPEIPDGIFRVVIISTGSVASIKIPEIVGALSKVRGIGSALGMMLIAG
jgi:phosphopantothenoylcysteine decarboxylase